MKHICMKPWLALTKPALVIVIVAVFGIAAYGQLGTSHANVPIKAATNATLASPPTPNITVFNAGYATGGVGLRNRRKGIIEISGVVPPVSDAIIYWAYLFTATPPATQTVTIHRITPPGTPTNPASTSVTGDLLATGADPCWGSNGIAIYSGHVPINVAYTNGAYEINLPAKASASNSGADPWTNLPATFPAAEGASLVLIGAGPATVSIFDAGLAGNTFNASFSYSLTIPSTPGNLTLWDNIGADGQVGGSRTDSVANETTFINGIQFSGPGGSLRTDSDWDGSSGTPLPQLWDDTGHDITAIGAGVTSLSVTFNSFGDCVTPVANVVSEQ